MFAFAFGDKDCHNNLKRTYTLYPNSKPSLAYHHEQFNTKPICLAFNAIFLAHLPVYPSPYTPWYPTCPCHWVPHHPPSPLYSLPFLGLCLYSFFHPTKYCLSSSPNWNAAPFKNEDFSPINTNFPIFYQLFGPFSILACRNIYIAWVMHSCDCLSQQTMGFLSPETGPQEDTTPGQIRLQSQSQGGKCFFVTTI